MRAKQKLIVTCLLMTVAGMAFSYPTGPIPSVTGGPSEGLCTDCHGGAGPNTGGSLSLVNGPMFYRPGAKYTITLRIASTQTVGQAGRSWGFQVTALNENGTGAGTFAIIPGQGTQILSGSGLFSTRRYVEHTSEGVRNGVASPAEWQFDWTAPQPGTGQVTFYASGLACDGDGSESGDWVYVGSFATRDTATAAVAASWGLVKSEYR